LIDRGIKCERQLLAQCGMDECWTNDFLNAVPTC